MIVEPPEPECVAVSVFRSTAARLGSASIMHIAQLDSMLVPGSNILIDKFRCQLIAGRYMFLCFPAPLP